MKTKKISVDQEKDIIKLYLEQKLSTTKISSLIGISPTSVSNIIKRNNLTTRNVSESKKGIKRGSKLPVSEIIKLYTQGLPSTEIAEKIKCSKRSVLNILSENNIAMRLPGRDKDYSNPLTNEIKKLYLSGKSINEVKKHTGLSYSGVNKILKKLKIIRTENKSKGVLGSHHSEVTKNKVRQTRKLRKEEGLYDHIYLKKTGLTYKEFQVQLPEFKKYFQKVRTITNQQPLETLINFEKRGKMGQDGAYNLDHKYSIIEGFKNGVDPELIGHISNLEMLPWKDNLIKQGSCSITINELKNLI